MSRNERLIFLALALAIVFSAVKLVIVRRSISTEQKAGRTSVSFTDREAWQRGVDGPIAENRVTDADNSRAEPTRAPSQSTNRPVPLKAAPRVEAKAQNSNPPVNQGQTRVTAPLQDPWAREALRFVGLAEEAETYWFGAINDPNLPAKERQDLIEDLNEDGLADPKHPTFDDLPLILRRIMIVETLAPEAMDEANAEAFREAYKDLVNLAFVAMGGGEPVR